MANELSLNQTVQGEVGEFNNLYSDDLYVQGNLGISAGNVGIGTTSPSEKLEVNGNIRVDKIIFSGDDSELDTAASSDALTIDSEGNVGIGTTNPQASLEVKNNDNATGGTIQQWTADLGQLTRSCSILAPAVDNFNSPFTFFTNNSWNFRVDTTDALTIDSDGNVGIGTTSPSVNLHVQGDASNVYIQDNLDVFNIGGGNAGSIYFGANASDPTAGIECSWRDTTNPTLAIGVTRGTRNPHSVYEYSSGAIRHITDGDERMRITHDGNVGIGKTNPSYLLHLKDNSAAKPSSSSWTVASDERLKEDIELADLDRCYELVKTIPLKRYKWKDEIYTEKQVYDRHKLGWIAQDVEASFPKAVRKSDYKYNQIYEQILVPAVPESLDDEGNVITPAEPESFRDGELISEDIIEDCRDLDSDQMYAAMYGAIQKLISKVELLEAKLATD